MENQRKNWRAEFFLKKIKKQGTFKKKILQWKNFAIKKNSSLGSSAAPPPPALWDPPRRGPLSHCRDQGRRSGKVRGPRRPGNPPSPLKTTALPAWEVGPRQRLHRWREREGEMDGGPRRRMAAPPPASWASPPLAWGDPETRSRSHGEVREGGKRNSEWERRGGMEKYRVGPAHVVDREFACLRATVKSRLRKKPLPGERRVISKASADGRLGLSVSAAVIPARARANDPAGPVSGPAVLGQTQIGASRLAFPPFEEVGRELSRANGGRCSAACGQCVAAEGVGARWSLCRYSPHQWQ